MFDWVNVGLFGAFQSISPMHEEADHFRSSRFPKDALVSGSDFNATELHQRASKQPARSYKLP